MQESKRMRECLLGIQKGFCFFPGGEETSAKMRAVAILHNYVDYKK